MIVQCNNCHKKFDLDANLIPEEGRLLQCSACNNTWFFKKKKIETPKEVTKPEIQNNKEEETISPKNDDANSSEKPSNDEIENVEVEKTIEPLPDKKNYRILNILVVLIISFAAFIIIIDTFKTPLGKIVPNTELLLYNLYETFRDIGLFIQDLF
ncbi:MAG: zinc-ribbon domain-containing protein [Candidatus Pelagibacter bacterium]|nr:zinc-ribbon domain-containing protein [Candidatus Pelagibacter bacterium]